MVGQQVADRSGGFVLAPLLASLGRWLDNSSAGNQPPPNRAAPGTRFTSNFQMRHAPLPRTRLRNPAAAQIVCGGICEVIMGGLPAENSPLSPRRMTNEPNDKDQKYQAGHLAPYMGAGAELGSGSVAAHSGGDRRPVLMGFDPVPGGQAMHQGVDRMSRCSADPLPLIQVTSCWTSSSGAPSVCCRWG